jgi:hypothetical protein
MIPTSLLSRWSFSALRRYIRETYSPEQEAALWAEIHRVMTHAVLAVYPTALAHARRHSPPFAAGGFQLLGVDIDIDSELKPWFIEANVNPSLGKSTAPFDNANKQALMEETLDLTGLTRHNATAEVVMIRNQLQHSRMLDMLPLRARDLLASDAGAWDELATYVYEQRHRHSFEQALPAESPALRSMQSQMLRNAERDAAIKAGRAGGAEQQTLASGYSRNALLFDFAALVQVRFEETDSVCSAFLNMDHTAE